MNRDHSKCSHPAHENIACEAAQTTLNNAKQGAESADIGKLDAADKSGVEMGKVNRVEKCFYCGRLISQLANDGNICTSPTNISEPDTVGNRHHVTIAFRDLNKESEHVRRMMREGDTEGLAAYANAGNRARASEIIRKRYAITPERIADAKAELAKDDAAGSAETGGEKAAEDFVRKYIKIVVGEKGLIEVGDMRVYTGAVGEWALLPDSWAQTLAKIAEDYYQSRMAESREPEKLNNACPFCKQTYRLVGLSIVCGCMAESSLSGGEPKFPSFSEVLKDYDAAMKREYPPDSPASYPKLLPTQEDHQPAEMIWKNETQLMARNVVAYGRHLPKCRTANPGIDLDQCDCGFKDAMRWAKQLAAVATSCENDKPAACPECGSIAEAMRRYVPGPLWPMRTACKNVWHEREGK